LPRRRIAIFAGIISSVVFSASAFVGITWAHFAGAPAHGWSFGLMLAALSFLPLMLMGWRLDHPLLRVSTTVAASAVGLLNFFFFGAAASWLVAGCSWLLGLGWSPSLIASLCFGTAGLVALYGFLNASWIRISRVEVRLPGLPEAWVGRRAAVVTDVHLGNIRRNCFIGRLVARLNSLKPDVVLLSGDLFDGTRMDPMEPLKAWEKVQAPLGTYFVTGNHDEHFSRPRMFEALRRAGMRILENEAVMVDGLKLVGIHDEEAGDPELLKSLLARAEVKPGEASILLTHQPLNLPIAEAAGVGLQVSGHTHAGQFWPWNLVVSCVWGPFGYGLNRLGGMWVLTSSGVGTWGPPLRVGTRSELVLVTFGRV
jgi:predicted MPP superfamily phosphohydrolase